MVSSETSNWPSSIALSNARRVTDCFSKAALMTALVSKTKRGLAGIEHGFEFFWRQAAHLGVIAQIVHKRS